MTIRYTKPSEPLGKFTLLWIAIAFLAFNGPAWTQEELHVVAGSQEILAQSQLGHPTGVATEIRLQESSDLKNWRNVGSKEVVRAATAWSRTLATRSPSGFYRLLSRPIQSFTSGDSADILGYAGTFADELEATRRMSLDDFSARYDRSNPYLANLSWDITEGEYWDLWNKKADGSYLATDFTLDKDEFAVIQRNGFVVSERLGRTSLLDLYYEVFRRDLPVMITTDSILHAWHRSFDSMVIQLEEHHIHPLLKSILDKAAAEIPRAKSEFAGGPLEESLRDADLFLAVARSLISGTPIPSSLQQDDNLIKALNAVASLQPADIGLFGRTPQIAGDTSSVIDFSQFTVRGHYEKSERLARLFKAQMWCGLIDLRVAGPPNLARPRELGTAIVLLELMKRASQMASWHELSDLIGFLVGPQDSMNLEQLDALLTLAGIDSPKKINSLEDLRAIQEQLESGDWGSQLIQGHFYTAFGENEFRLPRSFALFGQRFTMDSWALNQVTFSRVPILPSEGGYRMRRVPSCLDVAWSVLGNDQSLPLILSFMKRGDGHPFRDGIPYHPWLAAVRNTIDLNPLSAWESSVYSLWLHALRSLSEPTTGPEFPEAMRTHAWAMKNLNTQLASWTQLRHDTILYVKQSASTTLTCSYPAGFIEPRPEFYRRMKRMAELTRALPLGGDDSRPLFTDPWNPEVFTKPNVANWGIFKTNLNQYLNRFSETMARLEVMSEKELLQEPFDTNEIRFLQDVVEVSRDYFGLKTYSGWLSRLFYGSNEGVSQSLHDPFGGVIAPLHDGATDDRLVADVHTDTPCGDCGDPEGAVLHEGVGAFNFLMIGVDNGPDRMIYGGAVFSHYEHLLPGMRRLTDTTWKERLDSGDGPEPPSWTRDFLVR